MVIFFAIAVVLGIVYFFINFIFSILLLVFYIIPGLSLIVSTIFSTALDSAYTALLMFVVNFGLVEFYLKFAKEVNTVVNSGNLAYTSQQTAKKFKYAEKNQLKKN
jgi:hypothetical protein